MAPARPSGKPLLEAVLGRRGDRLPIWIMRQAGRYLPEYRATRAKADSFLDLCFSPRLASEVTLQPLKRFDLDAAILFSDILVVPHALGQSVRFVEGEGPVLDPVDGNDWESLHTDKVCDRLQPVFETVSRVRQALDTDKTLIGFCGSPWTVATYMVGGRGSADQAATRRYERCFPEQFDRLIDKLVVASADYLCAQLAAGADVVQLFESWALNMDDELFERLVIEPNRRIVERVRARVPGAAIIGFPRGAGMLLPRFAERTGVNVLGLDYAVPPLWIDEMLPETLGVQGNLDPMRLVAGGAQMERRIETIVSAFARRPHIFNLGHGIVPETPIEHVVDLISWARRFAHGMD